MLLRVLGGLSDMTRGEIGDSNTGGGDELCNERDDRRGNPRFNILPVMDSNHSVTQVKLEKTDPGVLVLQNIQGYARPHPAAL